MSRPCTYGAGAEGSVRNLVRRAGFPSGPDKAFTEHDGELCLGLGPFAMRHFPFPDDLAQDQKNELRRRSVQKKDRLVLWDLPLCLADSINHRVLHQPVNQPLGAFGRYFGARLGGLGELGHSSRSQPWRWPTAAPTVQREPFPPIRNW